MKNTFFVFCLAKIQSLVLETKHLQIMFRILDPPGMFGVRNPTFTNYFLDFGPTWDVWCWKPNIYELFLRFWTYTWDAWCWKPIFRENVPKTLVFTRFGSRPEFCAGWSGWRQNGTRLAVRTLGSSRAWGQDDGSYTNSLKPPPAAVTLMVGSSIPTYGIPAWY